MKRIIWNSVITLSSLILFQSCQTDDSNRVPKSEEVKDFIWKGLNMYYLWQEDVPNLNDNAFTNQSSLNAFLKGYESNEALFNDLLYQKGTIDKFSVIYSDYRLLEQALSGNTLNNGVDYALYQKSDGSNQVFGFVRYILPNSDASFKDIHRGDFFYAVNGISLTLDNYRSLLAENSYTLSLAEYDDGAITPNEREVFLTKTEYSENPVFLKKIFNINGVKVGYIVYNGFYGAYDATLNAVFGELAAEGISELILDLRYNSGGLVSTATRLASMITGQYTGQIFAKQQWNSKIMTSFEASGDTENLINRFTNTLSNGSTINSLHLNKLYVLTSKSTASASELVINGLKSYINVIQIGRPTTGKNVGSITLYDSPSFGSQGKSSSHTYAMQPLVLKIVNKDGFGDYTSGLVPDYDVAENLNYIRPLGDEEETLLSFALNHIQNGGQDINVRQNNIKHKDVFIDVKSLKGIQNQMYIDNIP